MKSIKEITFYLLDMDGTIYLGNELIPGALDFLKTLKKQNKRYLFLTNNSSKSSAEYVEKLKKIGIEATEEEVFTSGEATVIELLCRNESPKVYLLGTPALEEEFKRAGIELVNGTDTVPDYVVLGFDQTLTYRKLWEACDYVRDGVPYIATHPDFNCPLAEGKCMPDTGAMAELIKASTGKTPYVVGKPNPGIIEAVEKKYGVSKDEMAMVGDRLYTDIQTGINAGIVSVLVYSGETTHEDYKKSDVRCDYRFESVNELRKAIEE